MLRERVSRPRRTPPPIADFGLSPAHPAVADEVRLYDFSYDPGGIGISIRRWEFGDGDTSSKVSPRHRFETDGTYEVRLTVTTFDGRDATVARSVRVG